MSGYSRSPKLQKGGQFFSEYKKPLSTLKTDAVEQEKKLDTTLEKIEEIINR